MIEFNLMHFPDEYKGRYQELNLQLVNEDGEIFGGIVGGFIKLDTLSFQALDFYLKEGFQVYGTIENAGSHTHYYLKKVIEER